MQIIIRYIGVVAICVSVYCLFQVKQHVQDLNLQLTEIEKQIRLEEDSIQMFRAELAYLKSPARIQNLAHKYLDLKPVQPKQMLAQTVDIDSTKVKKYNDVKAKRHYLKKYNKTLVNWRYKRAPEKYVVEISGR